MPYLYNLRKCVNWFEEMREREKESKRGKTECEIQIKKEGTRVRERERERDKERERERARGTGRDRQEERMRERKKSCIETSEYMLSAVTVSPLLKKTFAMWKYPPETLTCRGPRLREAWYIWNVISCQLKLIKLCAELASQSHCAVPF